MTNKNPKDTVLKAFSEALAECADPVKRLGISLGPTGASEQFGGWIIPVVTGPDGTARELVDLLDHLSEIVERKTGLDSTVLLDPAIFTPGLNGPAAA